MFGRWSDAGWQENREPEGFFEIRERLAQADLSLINLETALCEHEQAAESAPLLTSQRHRFTAPPAYADWLVAAGVDVAIVANNHAMDCGPQSLAWTIEHLSQRNIGAAGAPGTPVERDARFGATLLAFAGGRALVTAATVHASPIQTRPFSGPTTIRHWERDLASFVAHVGVLRATYADALLIVSLHWGRELAQHPAPHQRAAARRFVDAGADIVYGHGTHVVQELEIYDQKAIVYSAGNLFFDMRQPETRAPGLIELDLVWDGRWQASSIVTLNSLAQ
ncbi:MAG: CapA family protein [Bradymonadaceae bacterium]|nr:CapA family protein [Lujinxingiaceae bacterium]